MKFVVGVKENMSNILGDLEGPVVVGLAVVVRDEKFVGMLVGIFEGNDVVGVGLIVVVGWSVGNTIGDLEGSVVVGLAVVVRDGKFVENFGWYFWR